MTRPALAAVAEQQTIIENLRRKVASQDLVIDYIARMAGLTSHVAAIRTTADADNPGQPVPNPPSEAPVETTEQAVTPEAYDNPQAPGQTPGSVQDLPADTTGTPMDPGTTLPTAPYNQLTDVTAPVAGTETHVPNEQTRTEVDVRVGDPMNLQQAYPWTIASAQNRTMASMHLARLRIQAGIASGDDLQVAAAIEADASLSNEAIETEISTLGNVVKAASRRSQRPASAVPRPAAQVQRTTPSLVGTTNPGLSAEASMVTDTDAEDIFLD